MRLGVWQRAAVYVTLATVGLSGLVWFVLHDFIEEEPSELTRSLLVLHGISAFASLMVFGSLFPLHVRFGWLNRRNIVSGTSVIVTTTILIVTALLLYYGGEETRMVARWIHIVVGGFCFAIVPLHVVLGRLSRNPSRVRSGQQAIESSRSVCAPSK